MTNNLIDLLKQQVSAIVLEGETAFLPEKNSALNNFYPILLTIFKNKPHLLDVLKNQLNPRLGDLFQSNPGLKGQFLDAIRGGAPSMEIESTLSNSILPTVGFLENQAGSSDPDAIAHLIDTQYDSVHRALPSWAATMLAAMGVNTAYGQTVHQTPETVTPVVVQEKKSSALLPIIAIIILGLLAAFWFKACSDKKTQEQTAVPAPVQTAATQPASLQLSTNDKGELVTCQMYVNNSSYIDILQQQVKQIFNSPLGCGAAAEASYHTEYTDQDAIPSVLKLLHGVPNVSMNWIGDQLTLQTGNPAETERLASQIQTLAKNMKITVNKAPDAAAASDVNTTVDNSITDSQKALAAINPDHVRALDVATALNMQIINFPSASANIPDANKSILDQAAALMQRAKHVQLTVTGYTDATGNADANKKLSLQRAKAVVDYLVSKGVDPAQLRAAGMGQENPVADNSTPEGQFKNRRIEFEVLNSDTGVVREVDANGVKEQY